MRIAIVGGIGSGKSEALNVARKLNLATISCDEINAALLQDKDYLDKLFKLFPTVNINGVLDKKELSRIIYNSPNEREKLNSLAHPIIFEKIFSDKRDPLVVEIPLFSNEIKKHFDEVILISTNKDKRVKLLKENRGMSEDLSSKIIDTQMSEKELELLSTKVINNDTSLEELIDNVYKVLKDIIDY